MVQQWSQAALPVTIESVIVQNKEVSAADVDGCVVVLSVGEGSYFGFNRVASEIWNMLTEPRQVCDIISCLAACHDIDAETVTRDVTLFLHTLIEHRLVRLIGPDDLR